MLDAVLAAFGLVEAVARIDAVAAEPGAHAELLTAMAAAAEQHGTVPSAARHVFHAQALLGMLGEILEPVQP